MQDMQRELGELLDRERIRHALLRYTRGVDRRDWALVATAYHPDAYDDHGGYKGGVPGLLQWLEQRHQSIEQSMHTLGNCSIDFLSPGSAIAETYCVTYRRYGGDAPEAIRFWPGDRPLPDGRKVMAELACRFVDRFEKREGEWRIVRRMVVLEEIKASAEPVRLRAGHALATRDRTDPLWQALSAAE